MIGVLTLVVGLVLTVTLHELAHLVVARRNGMHCSRFFFGFGPTLYARTLSGGMEIGIKLIPLGGFVTIDGMTRKQAEEMPPDLQPAAYINATTRARLATTIAGPACNLMLGAVSFLLLAVALGIPQPHGVVTATTPASPAQVAVGDRYEMVGERASVATTTGPVWVSASQATLVPDRDRSPVPVVNFAAHASAAVVGGTLTSMATLPVRAVAAFVDPHRTGGPVSLIGAGKVAASAAASPHGVAVLVGLFASMNLSIAVLNLLPLPPFDGGHAAVAFWGWVRRKAAAAKGRPLPGVLDASSLTWLTVTVMVIFLSSTVALMVADIVNPAT